MNTPLPPWLTTALGYMNLKEIEGQETNPEIVAFFKALGHEEIQDDAVPWCAAFLGACLERAGVKSTKSLLARSYLAWGKPLANPDFGAIAVFKRGADPNAGHVGIIMGKTTTDLLILGGNQANAVNIRPYPRKDLLSVRWPEDSGKAVKTSEITQINETKTVYDDKPSERFQRALTHVLKFEGGWSNHKEDPGGPTNFGITLGTYRRAVRESIVIPTTASEIEALRALTRPEVEAIYWQYYWQAAHCDELAESLALIHFDAAVNHGVRRALQFLQKIVGAVVDGEWGPETKALTDAKATGAPLKESLKTYYQLRQIHYQTRPHFKTFGKGWMRRLDAVSRLANSLIPGNEQPSDLPVLIDPPNPTTEDKPEMTTSNTTELNKWWAESLTVWGTIVTALATILPLIGPFIGLDITGEMVKELGETITHLIQILAGLTGTSMALYGRARAATKLTRRDMSVKL